MTVPIRVVNEFGTSSCHFRQCEHRTLCGVPSGSLPAAFGASLADLLTLNLRNNSLNGTFPSALGQEMQALRSLNLSLNAFSGSIPPGEACYCLQLACCIDTVTL